MHSLLLPLDSDKSPVEWSPHVTSSCGLVVLASYFVTDSWLVFREVWQSTELSNAVFTVLYESDNILLVRRITYPKVVWKSTVLCSCMLSCVGQSRMDDSIRSHSNSHSCLTKDLVQLQCTFCSSERMTRKTMLTTLRLQCVQRYCCGRQRHKGQHV